VLLVTEREALLAAATRHLFFTGKGGVGKTSIACATAVALSDLGRRVLLVSTDPASNLSDVLGTDVPLRPIAVEGAPGLTAYNLDPVAAAAAYRERVVGPYRGVLPDASVAGIEEQLSGACTVEIAAFDEFSRILGDPEATAGFDHVVFDTAPTGHTLRLLSLPTAWTDFLATNSMGTSCLGPLAGLESQRSLYTATLAALADADQTTVILVTRPESSALAEAARTSTELRGLDIVPQRLMVNAVFVASDARDPLAVAFEERGRAALSVLPTALRDLERTDFDLVPYAPLGVEALRAFWRGEREHRETSAGPVGPADSSPRAAAGDIRELIDAIAAPGHGVVLVMGKGGVGKTTIAAAIGFALSERGYPVHLNTTDPAAGLERALDASPAGFTVSRIDPEVEVARYRAEVMAEAGAGLDAQGRALLDEDLRSPCTEEIAVFRAFARTVAEGREGFVVLDTAPTGHTILLLDAALAYHRELGRQSGGVAPEVQQLLPRLRDPGFTKVILVVLPEATPVNEAEQLAGDLERAGISPFAWVVNQSLTPTTVTDPLLRARRMLEADHLRTVEGLAARFCLMPWRAEPPTGRRALLDLVTTAGSHPHSPKEA
jgi:arsenite/tail-anchored protein-transporting ATPase